MVSSSSDRNPDPQRRGRGGGGRTSVRVASNRGVFMISVAAELAEMHPQTLRMYEARGLITPKRSPRNTRLYSQDDVERLRRIQHMTAEEGLNLAGVETVLELEEQLTKARSELKRMRAHTAELEARMLEEVEKVRRAARAEIVPYGAYQTQGIKIPIRRARGGGRS